MQQNFFLLLSSAYHSDKFEDPRWLSAFFSFQINRASQTRICLRHARCNRKTSMDEQKLIEFSQQGRLESFNQLVLIYQEMVFNTAYRILGDDDSAEDASQVAFINAYRNIKQYRGGSFKAWLLRTATNACYDELRRQKRRPTIPLEPVVQSGNEEMDSPSWLADDTPSPEDVLESKEIERAVQNCIQALPDEFRTIVVLVDIQGLDYSEASGVIGKPLGTVKSRLARARLRLRDCLNALVEPLPVNQRLVGEGK